MFQHLFKSGGPAADFSIYARQAARGAGCATKLARFRHFQLHFRLESLTGSVYHHLDELGYAQFSHHGNDLFTIAYRCVVQSYNNVAALQTRFFSPKTRHEFGDFWQCRVEVELNADKCASGPDPAGQCADDPDCIGRGSYAWCNCPLSYRNFLACPLD